MKIGKLMRTDNGWRKVYYDNTIVVIVGYIANHIDDKTHQVHAQIIRQIYCTLQDGFNENRK